VIAGEGTSSFGQVVFTNTGEYNYTVYEIASGAEGYTYDTSIYYIKVKVGYTSGSLKAVYSVHKDQSDGKSPGLNFVNQYKENESEKPKETETETEKPTEKETETEGKNVTVQIVTEDVNGKPVEGSILRVVDEDGNIIDEWVTDGTPHVIKAQLVVGHYYRLVDVYEPDGYQIAEDVVFRVAEDGSTERVTVATEPENIEKASVQITKELTLNHQLMSAKDDAYYVALFADKDCTKRLTEIKKLTFQNTASATVEFQKLQVGKTYYLSETDVNGQPISKGTLATGETYQASYGQGQEIQVEKDGTAALTFENQFSALPKDCQLVGRLNITKRVQDAEGNAKSTSEIFYAGIFDDATFSHLSSYVSSNVVELKMNGKAESSTSVQVTLPESGSRNLYVTEVDKNGIPVKDSAGFSYELTVENSENTFTQAQYERSVVLTNRVKAEPAQTETPGQTTKKTTTTKTTKVSQTEETKSTENKVTTKTSSGTTIVTGTKSTSSPKTGDNTNMKLWITLLILAGVCVAGVAVTRKKKHQSHT
jgi:pilin isopeptide linkage protein